MSAPAAWSWRLAAGPCSGCGASALAYLCSACDRPTCGACGRREGSAILCGRDHDASPKDRALALRDELLAREAARRAAA